jgi:hypothetical protein
MTGIEPPPPAKKTIDAEGRAVKDGVMKARRDRLFRKTGRPNASDIARGGLRAGRPTAQFGNSPGRGTAGVNPLKTLFTLRQVALPLSSGQSRRSQSEVYPLQSELWKLR